MPAGDPLYATAAARHPLAAIALYPLQGACLTTLVALAIGMPLTLAPLVGYLIQLVIWAAAYHYAVEVFERSANGTPTAPEFATESDGIGWTLLFLQIAFSVGHWWLQGYVSEPLSRWLGIGLIAVLQPAMTLTTAMNRQLSSALNPARVLRVIAALGSAYALLVAAGLGMGALQEFVDSVVAGGRAYILVVVAGIGLGGAQQVGGLFFGNGWVAILAQVVAGFAWCYAVVAWFHAMGKAVHAHSDALGFVPAPQRALRPEDRHGPLLKRVEELAMRKEHAAAAHVLGECLASQPHASPEMHARYRELLRLTGDQAALVDHARARIDALLVAGSHPEALALAREALAIDPMFRPGSGERTTELAREAERLGQPELALALLRDFMMRHPRDPAIPENAITAARLLLERHSDVAGARSVLQAAIDRMLPAHPMYADLLQKLNRLDQLSKGLPDGPQGH